MRRPAWVLLVLVVVVLAAGCSPPPLAVPPTAPRATATLPDPREPTAAPSGAVTVAYPDEPSRFLRAVGDEVATDDLAALWGLPLLRLDPAGQLRRGLVRDWEVLGDDGFTVRLALRPGDWSDGSPVVAADVVASLQARVAADTGRFGVIEEVREAPGGRVDVVFDRPYAAWADLLVEAGPMLPSEQAEAGTDGYLDDIPVSGGWYRLATYEPGLRLVLEAHAAGPLGAPRLARIEVLFTPSYETALGLLESGEVDLALGYLPLNGVARATEVDGVTAASPLGGTTVSLEFRPGGALGGDELAARRRGIAETVDVGELVEGLLGPYGEVATSPWPLAEGPADPPLGEVREGQELVVVFPSGGEVVGFTARAIQRDLSSRGMTVDLVGEPAPRFAEVVGTERDVAMVVRRTPRRPSLAPWLADQAIAHGANASPADGADARTGLAAVAELARSAPLFRVGVLHAWRGVEGIRPSAWVGAGFWNAGEWTTPDS